jgi:hypothetical protein
MRIRRQQKNHELLADPGIGLLPTDRALLTSRETADALKISARTLSYWTAGRRPRLSYVKLGKTKRFVVADVLRFIEEHKVRVA